MAIDRTPLDLVLRDPDVMHGEPVFRGTRVPVVTLVDFLEDSYTIAEFRDGFPGVSHEQVQAALQVFREAPLSQPKHAIGDCHDEHQ